MAVLPSKRESLLSLVITVVVFVVLFASLTVAAVYVMSSVRTKPQSSQASLARLNGLSRDDFVAELGNVIEKSPGITELVWDHDLPVPTPAALKHAFFKRFLELNEEGKHSIFQRENLLMCKRIVTKTGEGEENVSNESNNEQGSAGLNACSQFDADKLRILNNVYRENFGYPFVIAVLGPRDTGITRREIFATLEYRLLKNDSIATFMETCRQVARVCEMRLNAKLTTTPTIGIVAHDWIMDLVRGPQKQPDIEPVALPANDSSSSSPSSTTINFKLDDNDYLLRPIPSPYLSVGSVVDAYKIKNWMEKECRADEVTIDAVGNVVGVFYSSLDVDDKKAGSSSSEQHNNNNNNNNGKRKRLLVGSHYDTPPSFSDDFMSDNNDNDEDDHVGTVEGRIGIVVPLVYLRSLRQQDRRPDVTIEVVAFAGELVQEQFGSDVSLIGSRALMGDFESSWLDRRWNDDDDDEEEDKEEREASRQKSRGSKKKKVKLTMSQAMQQAGLCCSNKISSLQRNPSNYLAFMEIRTDPPPHPNDFVVETLRVKAATTTTDSSSSSSSSLSSFWQTLLAKSASSVLGYGVDQSPDVGDQSRVFAGTAAHIGKKIEHCELRVRTFSSNSWLETVTSDDLELAIKTFGAFVVNAGQTGRL